MIHPPAPSVKFRTIDDQGIMFIGLALVPSPGLVVIDKCWRVGMTLPERVDFKDLPIASQEEILKDVFFRVNNGVIDDFELPTDWEDFTCENVAFTYAIRSKYALEDVKDVEAARALGLKHVTRIVGTPNDWKTYLVYSTADWNTTAADLKAAIVF